MQVNRFSFIVFLFPLCLHGQDFTFLESISKPAARHECAAAVVHNQLFLLGGRGNRPVNRFNFKTSKWDSVAALPRVINHFQAAVYKDEIFIAGAFTGNYPHEQPIAEVYAFNTKTDTWRIETTIPEDRRRGGASCIVYKEKLYIIAGITDGHYDGHVSWVDVYDFKKKQWTQLQDVPHARDHFQVVVVNNKLYAVGGRKSSALTKQVFQLTVPEVDVYDFEKNNWSTLDTSNNIPTQRAGCTTIAFGKNKFMVLGGESGAQQAAHAEAELFDVSENKWQSGKMMQQGRHGTQAVVYKGKVYICAGSANKGGGPELNNTEICKIQQ
jgi:N-acetylneuraminic acid mutarotase